MYFLGHILQFRSCIDFFYKCGAVVPRFASCQTFSASQRHQVYYGSLLVMGSRIRPSSKAIPHKERFDFEEIHIQPHDRKFLFPHRARFPRLLSGSNDRQPRGSLSSRERDAGDARRIQQAAWIKRPYPCPVRSFCFTACPPRHGGFDASEQAGNRHCSRGLPDELGAGGGYHDPGHSPVYPHWSRGCNPARGRVRSYRHYVIPRRCKCSQFLGRSHADFDFLRGIEAATHLRNRRVRLLDNADNRTDTAPHWPPHSSGSRSRDYGHGIPLYPDGPRERGARDIGPVCSCTSECKPSDCYDGWYLVGWIYQWVSHCGNHIWLAGSRQTDDQFDSGEGFCGGASGGRGYRNRYFCFEHFD